MTLFPFVHFAAAVLTLFLASVSLWRKRSMASWCFFAGMMLLGIDSLFAAMTLRATAVPEVIRGLTFGLIVKSLVPAAWLAFSVTYSRGDWREALSRWRVPLAALVLLPLGLSLGFRQQFFELAAAGPGTEDVLLRLGTAAKVLNAVLLISLVLILMNLEQTFRSAVGTMRWRIKFVVLGLAMIFGARLYVRSQALLYSIYDMHWPGIESSALLIGCVLLVIAYARTGFAEIDVYPSRVVLGSSMTVLLAGGYLFVVGILANVVRRVGGVEGFQIGAFVILLGMAGLALLLLSDRLRQRVHRFVNRHFRRAQHDSVRIWTDFSRRLSNVKDPAGLCAASARLISETFEVLSVTIWLLSDQDGQFVASASTAPKPVDTSEGCLQAASSAVADGLRPTPPAFDLEQVDAPWAEELRQLNPTTFPNGGHRWCLPWRAGQQTLGALVLADRVNGADYTDEELHLLRCIADQATSVLLNLRLANEVAQASEMEAFRTMSAFFVHDLKNTASSLNLMLKNLPVHFDDPAFREDALRGISNTTQRIEEMIARLTALRQRPALNQVAADLNQLVGEALDRLDGMPHVQLTKEFQPLPGILADREQIRGVVTNLVLNARDALGPEGCIRLRTEQLGGSVVLTVTDNGCGMSGAFLKDRLFRPFQSTKKKGIGIGMFQSRVIVEAHGGNIRVESEPGKGSTFRVSLPIKDVK